MNVQVERWHPHAFVNVVTFRNEAVKVVITAVPRSFQETCETIMHCVHE